MDAQYLFRCFQLNPGDVYIEPEHRAKLTTRLEAFKESLWRHSDETNKLANAEMVDLMAAGKATPLIERKTDKRTVFLAEQLRQKRRENLRKILLRSAKRPKSPNAHLLDNEMALEARLDKKVPADWWPSGAQDWVGGDGGYICKRGEDGGLYSATLDMLPKTKEARQNSKRTLNAMADVIVNWFVDRGAFPRERAGELLDWCYRGLDIRKRMADPALRERTMELLRIAPR